MTSPPTPSPALPPPPGQQSNFVNPVSLWKWDVLAVTVCLFVSTIVFGLRTYVRLGIKREWIPEDCTSLLVLSRIFPLTSCRYVLRLLCESKFRLFHD